MALPRSIYDREYDKFVEVADETAVRVKIVSGTELAIGVDYDRIDVTYPTATTEQYDYTLAASSVLTIEVTYATFAKKDITSVAVI